MGYRMLMKLAEELATVAAIEFAPKKEGRNMTMVLGPLMKKSAVKKQAPAAPVEAPTEA
jgi:translation initiation factor IF-3